MALAEDSATFEVMAQNPSCFTLGNSRRFRLVRHQHAVDPLAVHVDDL
jgi:hypothetical protein